MYLFYVDSKSRSNNVYSHVLPTSISSYPGEREHMTDNDFIRFHVRMSESSGVEREGR
jgi:hypothetical protein